MSGAGRSVGAWIGRRCPRLGMRLVWSVWGALTAEEQALVIDRLSLRQRAVFMRQWRERVGQP